MKSLVLAGKNEIRLEEVSVPSISENEVLVKMHACGVCGTDLEKVRGEALTPPVLGHEVVGEIVRSNSEHYREGARVFVHHHAPCYNCYYCSIGEYTLCEEFPKHNIFPGGFSEYFSVPSWNVERKTILELPDDLDYNTASLIEPLACCIRALEKAWTREYRNVSIFGAGPAGLMFLLLLKERQCKVNVLDPSEYRRNFALKLGAESAMDRSKEAVKSELAIVATGNPNAFTSALNNLSKAGKLLIFGSPASNSMASVRLSDIFINGITITSSYSTTELETKKALDLLRKKKESFSRIITHTFKLDDVVSAFEIASRQSCIKAVVTN